MSDKIRAARRETLEQSRYRPVLGARVEARYMAQSKGVARTSWLLGNVASAPDATGACDVEFEGGDFESKVPALFIRAAPTSSASASAEPAASSASSAAATGSALGKRKIKATTVMVDGHAVKRQNMYDMEEGEGSVWDREVTPLPPERCPPTAPADRKADRCSLT
jgi:hypothetical protein